ncbi:MAG: YbjN domain-containing protein [Acidimicrobiales bacterium mtb01]|nr:YbjN domain-containing protein [Actinomycetota bacterium]TEX48383.1 MAG: YbjN domain-containing protein [Acidimicrobiales bacterium mtb01]
MSDLFDDESLAVLERQIDEWLGNLRSSNSAIVAIDHAEPEPAFRSRWYVRMAGESKEFTTIWITLGQRTLRYETYVMPAPEENALEVFDNLLRRNEKLIGAHFSIGAEDAVFLRGDLPLSALSEAELDRIVGSTYAYVEQSFRPLLRIGFASRFRDE